MAAYVFLAAYARYGMQQEQFADKQMRLSALTQLQRELLHKRDVLEKVQSFSSHVANFKLDRKEWLFYDVNVQGEFNYEAAQKIIEQCSDSKLAYYWPIALEIKAIDKTVNPAKQTSDISVQSDVQLTVKGKFVARR